jgi:DNA-binding response OmpR family regulator
LSGLIVPLVFCERDQADGDWKDLLNGTLQLGAPPNVIVFSRLANERLWAEVLNLGGFDVLISPFDPEEVRRVALAAWRRWEADRARVLLRTEVQPPQECKARLAGDAKMTITPSHAAADQR